jgi:hypothetical protein
MGYKARFLLVKQMIVRKVRKMSRIDLKCYFSKSSLSVFCIFVTIWLSTSVVLAQSPADYLTEGVQEYFKKHFDSCIDVLQKVIDSPSSSREQKVEALAFTGASYSQKDDTLRAESTFVKCMRLDPSYDLGMDFTLDIRVFYRRLKQEILVSLTITSEPSGATVFLNGNSVGTTHFTKDTVFAGDLYDVLLTLDCYKEIRTQIKIERGKQNLFHFEMERLFCPLYITCEPKDADKYFYDLEGRTVPWTDSIPCGGKFVAKFSKKDYQDTTVSLDCLAGEAKNLLVTLIPKSEPPGPLKYWASAWCVGALGSYIYFNSKAKSSYDRYMESVYIDDINRNWNDHENNVTIRDVSGWTTAGLAAWSGYLWYKYIRWKLTHRHARVKNAFNTPEKIGIGLDARDGQVKIFLTEKF